jgi:rhamnosyl/mannosyltransferase
MRGVPELVASRAKVQVLPFGVSPRLVARPRSGDAGVRLEAGPLHLLFVGRLVYYKGIDVLLKALSLTSHANLRIVGDGADRNRLEALSVQLGVNGRTQFLGSLPDDDLVKVFGDTDVFVLPSVSRAETFGLAMVEAMGNGLPAISTSLGTGTDWVNLNDVSGVVVQPGDAKALALAIERLTDPDLRRRLGEGALERVHEVFSFGRHVDALEAAYRVAAG